MQLCFVALSVFGAWLRILAGLTLSHQFTWARLDLPRTISEALSLLHGMGHSHLHLCTSPILSQHLPAMAQKVSENCCAAQACGDWTVSLSEAPG